MSNPFQPALKSASPEMNRNRLPKFLVKLGGSFLESPQAWPAVSDWLQRFAETTPVWIVVGGGPRVRQLQRSSEGLPNDQTHWQAIEIMRDNARWLASQWHWPLLPLDSLPTAPVASDSVGSAILLPEDRCLANPMLPVGWEVTSDSIATWIGLRLNIANVVLTKQVNPLEPVLPAARMCGLGWVDQHLPKLLQQFESHRCETTVWIRHFPPKDLRPPSLRRVNLRAAGNLGPGSAPMDRQWTVVWQGGTPPGSAIKQTGRVKHFEVSRKDG